MKDCATDRYATRAAALVQTLILRDEELNPLPEVVSAGTLLARVTERLGQASLALQLYEGTSEYLDDEDASLLTVGIYLLGAAAFAITAVPRLLPDDEVAPTEQKDALLEHLDEQVEFNEADVDGPYANAPGAGFWPASALVLLVCACEGVCELQMTVPFGSPLEVGEESLDEDEEPDDEWDEGEEPDDEWDIDEWAHPFMTKITDSLMEAAAVAATGGQWCIERHEELEARQSPAAGKRRAGGRPSTARRRR